MAKIIALSPIFERIPAPVKKFKEVVVIVHHYGGNRYSFKRSIDWLNELGFDCVTFDLPIGKIADIRNRLPISNLWNFGLRHVWSDKIESVLGSLAEDKFVFSYSSPSAAVLTSLAKRHGVDVKGWVCEGGPFADMALGIENLIRSQGLFKIRSRFFQNPFLLRSIATACAYTLGMYRYNEDLQSALCALPKGFPIVSIRGGEDILVSVDMIDKVFLNSFYHVDLQRVILHNAGHVTAIKDESENYKYVIGNFLKLRGTPL